MKPVKKAQIGHATKITSLIGCNITGYVPERIQQGRFFMHNPGAGFPDTCGGNSEMMIMLLLLVMMMNPSMGGDNGMMMIMLMFMMMSGGGRMF